MLSYIGQKNLAYVAMATNGEQQVTTLKKHIVHVRTVVYCKDTNANEREEHNMNEFKLFNGMIFGRTSSVSKWQVIHLLWADSDELIDERNLIDLYADFTNESDDNNCTMEEFIGIIIHGGEVCVLEEQKR